jgi:protein-L-isoaspartate(D-aspartate) O-methyltransferase
MVEEQLKARDIVDPRVLEAMGDVPRHLFVAPEQWPVAYEDRPLPIPEGQTISQPYIVALMTQLADPDPGDTALDVGTGSGYQAAVLADLVDRVHGIEIHCPLADAARERLDRLGYDNVEVRCGDGYRGWPEHAPFDVIILAAAPPEVPPALDEQLAPGGRLVLPVGDRFSQQLIVIEKRPDGSTTRRTVAPVAFVPMTGEVQKRRPRQP